jgi:N-acetylglucosaminyl-diphospho-decaprenol L-rhamnosyltransferase
VRGVDALVVWTPGDEDATEALESLLPQVDRLVLVANGGRPDRIPEGVTVVENDSKLGIGANINRGIAATTAPFVVTANPDTIATPGSIETLRAFAASHPRCGIAGPQLRYPDGTWQPSRRTFPTVSGTLVRRTPLRLVFKPQERQRSHYLFDEQPTEPTQADWIVSAFLLLRRQAMDELGGYDTGFRLYGDEIDLAYRARGAGWERWYVPEAIVIHDHQAVTDHRFLTRRTLWHWRSIIRFVRKHPESLRAL